MYVLTRSIVNVFLYCLPYRNKKKKNNNDYNYINVGLFLQCRFSDQNNYVNLLDTPARAYYSLGAWIDEVGK